MHGGHNQWVWSLVRSTIKRNISVDQEINGCFKEGSSDQERILAIKNFDRRRRWKYRVHSGDYPLAINMTTQSRSLLKWNRALEILDCIDWNSLLPCDADVDAYWSAWKNYFMQAIELSIPHTVTKVKKNLPWINSVILGAIRKRDIQFRTAKSSGKSSDLVNSKECETKL